MHIYPTLPRELVDGWKQSLQTLAAYKEVRFHYHDVEEWLVVVSGTITFFTLANQPFRINVGRALLIPQGEVHRAEVGPDGVDYEMFLPVAVTPFIKELTTDELSALRRNLDFADYEDGRIPNGQAFFEDVLSDDLVFCRASGVCVDKKTFIDGAFVDKNRSSAGSIQILNRTVNGLLISTVVNVGSEGGVNSFNNVRFLAVERETFRCRLWANYPQPVAAQPISMAQS
jgi:hypothetical protein